MRRRMCLLIFSVAGLGAFGSTVASASIGTPGERFRGSWSYTLTDVDVCGVNVDVVEEGKTSGRVWYSGGEIARFSGTVAGTSTWTADNGKAVVLRYAQQFDSPARIVLDEEAGTSTAVLANRGLKIHIRATAGGLLIREAGLLSFVHTYDLETGELLVEETHMHGPHPVTESDNTLHCELISNALR